MTIACSTSVRCGHSLESALRAISEAGFRAIDLLAIDKWVHVHTSELASDYETNAQRLASMFQHYGVYPAYLNVGTGGQLHDRSSSRIEARRRELKAVTSLMQRFGISIAAIQPRNPDASRPWNVVFEDCVATLRDYQAAAAEAGVSFALELHANSPFETMEQAELVLEAMPDLKLVYDPTHFVMQGIEIEATEWLLEKAIHVHLRDADLGKMQTAYGQGALHFDKLFQMLQRKGYRGGFSIEYLDNEDFDAVREARLLCEHIKRYYGGEVRE